MKVTDGANLTITFPFDDVSFTSHWPGRVGALLITPGCDPGERTVTTAEVDDPGFRRGKELLRQGRNQEALAAFLKVIEKRGEDGPESHLEAGLLYQFHIKDPIAAIYHYRKYCDLKPNAPQVDLVRQRIESAKRELRARFQGIR
jgi:tetratricopeptide (TPR) repeat protein